MSHQRFYALTKPLSEYSVPKVLLRLRNVGQTEDIGIKRSAKATELREDEPHPVTFFVARLDLFQGDGKGGRLSLDEDIRVKEDF